MFEKSVLLRKEKSRKIRWPFKRGWLESHTERVQLNKIDWLIDFNGMSSRLGLFYDKRLGNWTHCTFIYRFFVLFFVCLFLFCTKSYRIGIILNRSIWFIVTTTPGQSRPGSNGSKGLHHSPKTSRTGVSLSNTVKSHTLDTSFFWGGLGYIPPTEGDIISVF